MADISDGSRYARRSTTKRYNEQLRFVFMPFNSSSSPSPAVAAALRNKWARCRLAASFRRPGRRELPEATVPGLSRDGSPRIPSLGGGKRGGREVVYRTLQGATTTSWLSVPSGGSCRSADLCCPSHRWLSARSKFSIAVSPTAPPLEKPGLPAPLTDGGVRPLRRCLQINLLALANFNPLAFAGPSPARGGSPALRRAIPSDPLGGAPSLLHDTSNLTTGKPPPRAPPQPPRRPCLTSPSSPRPSAACSSSPWSASPSLASCARTASRRRCRGCSRSWLSRRGAPGAPVSVPETAPPFPYSHSCRGAACAL